ncbi:MAG: hypothetical protein J7501_07965 [Bdellovibrio sp.]|nr:hypothetical protein [Bdellovibrio sp.]
MPKRVKNSQKSAGLTNDRGQAVIEYVLLLIISVSLILMLVYQIFKPMQQFVQGFMGDYVACLLETGELPALGGDDTAAADKGCTSKFNNVAGNANGGKGSGSSNSSSSDSSKNQDSSSSKNSSGSDSSNSSSNSRYAGSGSRNNGRYISNGRSGRRGLEGPASSQQGKVVEIALDGGGSGGFFQKTTSAGYVETGRKVASVPVTGLTEDEKKKLEKKANAGNKTSVAAGEGFTPAVKKIAVKKPEAKPVMMKEDEPLTIGNFIRYLFIAALIIALVIFLGGQALQFSKSGEK